MSVQARPGADKLEAKVAGIGTDVDLAVLTVEAHARYKKRPARPGSDSPFRDSDILTKVGDYEIDNTGSIRLENDLLAPFAAAIPTAARDGVVPVTVLRDGTSVSTLFPGTSHTNA